MANTPDALPPTWPELEAVALRLVRPCDAPSARTALQHARALGFKARSFHGVAVNRPRQGGAVTLFFARPEGDLFGVVCGLSAPSPTP